MVLTKWALCSLLLCCSALQFFAEQRLSGLWTWRSTLGSVLCAAVYEAFLPSCASGQYLHLHQRGQGLQVLLQVAPAVVKAAQGPYARLLPAYCHSRRCGVQYTLSKPYRREAADNSRLSALHACTIHKERLDELR